MDGGAGTSGDSGLGGNDGGPEAGSADAAPCETPTAWYRDSDGDLVGDDKDVVWSCVSLPGRVTTPGDCRDDVFEVHAGQTQYFPKGFSLKGSGKTSFDYDCDGSELPDNSQFGVQPKCSGVGIINCAGAGFVPTTRTGSGVNALCGSTALITCVATLTCDAQPSTVSDDQAKRCH
jgi:hypothetical protein